MSSPRRLPRPFLWFFERSGAPHWIRVGFLLLLLVLIVGLTRVAGAQDTTPDSATASAAANATMSAIGAAHGLGDSVPHTHPSLLRRTAWMSVSGTKVILIMLGSDGTGYAGSAPTGVGLDGEVVIKHVDGAAAIRWWVQNDNELCVLFPKTGDDPLCGTALVQGREMDWHNGTWSKTPYPSSSTSHHTTPHARPRPSHASPAQGSPTIAPASVSPARAS